MKRTQRVDPSVIRKEVTASARRAALKWDTLAEAWENAVPPSSPSTEDIACYENFTLAAVRRASSRDVLILGCTPRLRDLAARMQLRASCVDISKKMLEVSTHRVMPGARHQRLYCQNWLKMTLNRKFAAIVGDKVFDNVLYPLWPMFKRRLLQHLRKNGSLIVRVAPQDKALVGCGFSELFQRWAVRYSSGKLSCEDAASGLWEQALGASVRSVPGIQTIKRFNRNVRQLEKKVELLTSKEARLFRGFSRLFRRSASFEWTSYTLGNIIDCLAEELVLTGISRSSDYLVGFRQPVLEFRYGLSSLLQ